MNTSICTSKKHGHGPKPCGKPAMGDFCDDCSSRMVTDKSSGEEALNRQIAATARRAVEEPARSEGGKDS
jgi:hypothetical protein